MVIMHAIFLDYNAHPCATCSGDAEMIYCAALVKVGAKDGKMPGFTFKYSQKLSTTNLHPIN